MPSREVFAKNMGKYCPGCLIGIPTLGVVDVEFMLSMANLQTPLNWRGTTYVLKGKPVAEARNQLVELALEKGYQWLFFRDDDVLAAPEALNKLYSLKTAIAAGVVYGKQWPTHPMIFKWDEPGSMEDWKAGDVFEADWVGMGCTLINTEVFRAIEPPWFKTDPGSVVIEDGEVKGIQCHTEDAYFCKKAEAAGFKPIVDTNVQCAHVDVKTGTRFVFDPTLNAPVMVEDRINYIPWVYPTAVQRKGTKVGPYPQDVPDVVRFNLGAGNAPLQGYINVDMVAQPNIDEVGDCSRLRWLTRKYGLADEVYASHLLEHFRPEEVPGILRDWVHALKPNGALHIFVPDFEEAIKEYLHAETEDQANWQYLMYVMFGAMGEGMSHKCGITKNMLMRVMPQLPVHSLEITCHPKGSMVGGNPEALRRFHELEMRCARKADSVAGHGGITTDPQTHATIPEAVGEIEPKTIKKED